ncbi:MAG: metallophosphoesterase family protein [Promethearchaeota archaeon]
MADTHLGYSHYNLFERFKDFNKAFIAVLEKALQEEADFILLAGDMFNSNRINSDIISAIYLIITGFKTKCKNKLNREIPIIAIEGNHDKSSYFSKRSWMTFLADLDLIKLLEGHYDEEKEKFLFPLYSEKKHRGGRIQIKDIVIYGVPYFGSYTPKLFPLIYDAIPASQDSYNILMMHFGITGQVKDRMGHEIDASLQKLREKVDYLALGHFHKMYSLPSKDEWIYNPGSTEINDAREIWGIKGFPYERGVFLADIKGKQRDLNRIKHILCANGSATERDEISNRQFLALSLDINPDAPTSVSFSALIEFTLEEILKIGISNKGDQDTAPENLNLPFLLLSFFGSVPFSKLDLNINELRDRILAKFSLLGLRIFSGQLRSEADDLSVGARAGRTINEIETAVFQQLVEKNSLYKDRSESIVTLMKDLKKPLLGSKQEIEQLVNQIQHWWKFNLDEDKHVNLGEIIIDDDLDDELAIVDDLGDEPVIDDDLGDEPVIDEDLSEDPVVTDADLLDEDLEDRRVN